MNGGILPGWQSSATVASYNTTFAITIPTLTDNFDAAIPGSPPPKSTPAPAKIQPEDEFGWLRRRVAEITELAA